MRINVPEYLILLGLGVLNVWAALMLASVRSRSSTDRIPVIELGAPAIDVSQAGGARSEQRA